VHPFLISTVDGVMWWYTKVTEHKNKVTRNMLLTPFRRDEKIGLFLEDLYDVKKRE